MEAPLLTPTGRTSTLLLPCSSGRQPAGERTEQQSCLVRSMAEQSIWLGSMGAQGKVHGTLMPWSRGGAKGLALGRLPGRHAPPTTGDRPNSGSQTEARQTEARQPISVGSTRGPVRSAMQSGLTLTMSTGALEMGPVSRCCSRSRAWMRPNSTSARGGAAQAGRCCVSALLLWAEGWAAGCPALRATWRPVHSFAGQHERARRRSASALRCFYV